MFQKGTRVRFINQRFHNDNPKYAPPVGTVGVIVGDKDSDGFYEVQWPAGTTWLNGQWFALAEDLEEVKEGDV